MVFGLVFRVIFRFGVKCSCVVVVCRKWLIVFGGNRLGVLLLKNMLLIIWF